MATVFGAKDLRYDRPVAVKALHAELCSAETATRFHREIALVARLRHPHIVPLFDSGEGDGLLYYVMPLLEGESLRERLGREGRLPLAEVLRLAQQVGDALEHAHAHGVVHRDIKPDNILLEGTQAVVADFGIATVASAPADDRLTLTGTTVGTPAYMSPEQVTGTQEVDARSDQYSLACVVFEMLAGRAPFVVAPGRPVPLQHLADAPPSITELAPEVPARAASALHRALAKDPSERYPSIAAFIEALTDMSPASHVAQVPAATAVRRRTTPWWAIAGGGALLIAVTGAGFAYGWHRLRAGRTTGAGTPAAGASRPSVAIPPFSIRSDDKQDEYLSDGMTEELIVALSRVGRLRVPSRTSSFAYRSRALPTRALADSLGVENIVEGSLQRSGDSLHLLVSLVRAANDSTLWTDTFDRHSADVLAVQSEIAQAIASRLLATLLPDERIALAPRQGVNPEAHELYLKGRYHWYLRTTPDLQQAVSFFRQALALDPTYALAHAGLADAYSLLPVTGALPARDAFPLAREAARQALALDPTLSEAHVSLGIVKNFGDWDWKGAEAEFDSATVLDSTDAQAYYWRTWSLVFQGRMRDALASIERARALDPLSLVINVRLGSMLNYTGRYAEAESALRVAVGIDPKFPLTLTNLAETLALEGRINEALAIVPARGLLGGNDAGVRGFVLARAGRLGDARREALALSQTPGSANVGVATVYAAIGDRDAAMRYLNRSYQAHDFSLPFLLAEPMFASLRSDPEFMQLVARIGVHAPVDR